MSDPQPRFAIVTGAASGIGRAITQRLVDLGYRVAAVDRDEASLTAAVSSLSEYALPHVMDVADEDAWRRLIADWKADWPRLDLLVNNAGVLAGGELYRGAADDLRRVIEVNLWGTLIGCHTATPWLIESSTEAAPSSATHPQPGIINTASIFATLAPPGFAAYSASKAGVLALSESLRGELAPHGLNVTVTQPGTTPTQLFNRASFATPTFGEVVQRHQTASKLTAESVAEATLRAAAKGKPYAVIGDKARRFAFLKRLSPTGTLRRVAQQARRELGLPAPPESGQDK